MDDPSSVFLAFLLWRVIVSVIAALVVVWAAFKIVPGTSPALAPILLVVGLAFGVFWQAKVIAARRRAEKENPLPPMSTAVAFLGLAVLGGVLVGGIGHALHSWWIAALLGIGATLLAGTWYKWVHPMVLTRRHLVLTFGFLLGAACGVLLVAISHV